MGSGMSTELGQKSLLEENREELEAIRARLSANDPTLTNADVANRFIGDAAFIADVPHCLNGNTHITRLDLSYNQLTAAAMPALVDAITRLPQLRVLDLAGNRVGAEGCRLLGEYLASSPALEELILFHNDLYDTAVVPLANALLFNDSLAVLNLDQNNLTNASWVMLHKALTVGPCDAEGTPVADGNRSLISLKVGTKPSIVPSDALVDDVKAQLEANKARYAEKKASEEARRAAVEAAALEQQREAAREERRAAAEAQRAAEEDDAEQRQRREEEEEMLAYEEEATAQQRKSMKKSREEVRAERERMVAKAMDDAYDWRKKLTHDGSLVKEWRDGFTTLTTQPGDEVGAKPTATIGPPRRLQACWCDPHDVSVPYAKTLHYHCRHEDLNRPLEDGQVPKYNGCYASGHVCSSVGFYSKPKPDKSAAHFFSSPQRPAREEGNDVFEEGRMTNASMYSRTQAATAASTSTAAPAAIGY